MKNNKEKLVDGYYSASRKIGTVEDVSTHQALAQQDLTSNVQYLPELYDTNALIKNIIDVPIDDAFREGRTVGDGSKQVLDSLERFYMDGSAETELKHALKVEEKKRNY